MNLSHAWLDFVYINHMGTGPAKSKGTTTMQLTEPLMDLLYAAPDAVVFLVQDAIRATAAGDWLRAAVLMDYAAEAQDVPNDWFQRAGRAADELRAIAKATGAQA